jgi:hypothetical protein
MDAEAAVRARTTEAQKLYMESTLLRIAGALFCHDPKNAGKRTGDIELNHAVTDKHIIIRPDPRLGQPGPLAHKIFVALLKKHSDYGKPIRKEISFTRREIGRLIGRKEWGGRDSEQLVRALHEIHHTFITTHFRKAGARYQEHSFNIFSEILVERREFASDPIEACTITLAEPIVSSLEDEHFTCLNFSQMQELGTIGQALYMRIFFHFANLYTGVNGSRLEFLKRYDDVCAEWLGGLKVLRYASDIERQLGRHLDQLVQAGVLATFTLTKAKTAEDTGWVLTFRPGKAFFEDYARFYRRRQSGRMESHIDKEQRDIGEPLKLAYLFTAKRTGQPVSSIAYVNSKDVETAKEFLTQITFDEAPRFLDFALARAADTNFNVQTLAGLRQYLSPYKAGKAAAEAAEARQRAKQRQQSDEEDRAAYERDRRAEAAALFATLDPAEQAAIEEIARAKTATFQGSLRESMIEFRRCDAILRRHPDRLKTFEEWQAQR